MTIGNEIKRLREEKNISQEYMAGEMFSRSYISQIERGIVLPSCKAIQHIASVLNVVPLSLVDNQTIDKIISKDQVFDMFLQARTAYYNNEYEKCIQILPTIICAENMLDKCDLINAQVWYVDAYLKKNQIEKALELSDLFLEKTESYSRSELAIALKLIFIKGVIKYDKGYYHDSLSCFKLIESLIKDRHLDVDKTLVLDNLSHIQMLYESLGYDSKVDEYNQMIIELSKKYNLISKGTLRSINRYYRDNSSDPVDQRVAYYEFLMEVASLIGDTYRISVLKSSIVELFLNENYLDGLPFRLEDSKRYIDALDDSALKGYSYAFHNLFKGRYLVKLGEYDKALETYTKAQSFISDNKSSSSIKLEIDSLYNYAELYYHKGELESANMYLHMTEVVSKENETTVRNKRINQLKEAITKKQSS